MHVKESLNSVSMSTRDVFTAKMRATVKGLLEYRYALQGELTEDAKGRRAHIQALEDSGLMIKKIFGVDNSNFREAYKKKMNWDYERPRRVLNYVLKMVDIIPVEDLSKLIRDSQRLTAEGLISRYEAVKGEAKQSDYSGQPSGIDPNAFRYRATRI